MKKVTDFISNSSQTVDDDGKQVEFNHQHLNRDDFSLEGIVYHLLDPLLLKRRDGKIKEKKQALKMK